MTDATELNRELLRAGAYLLPDASIEDEERSDTIDARTYAHPALGERKVVRLTPSNLALGEDNTMSFFGFEAPEVRENIAQRARQALGFPEWVLVHDPKNAKKALDVAKKLKKGARRAKSKPGHARDAFDAVGQDLAKATPHFLPSYWEEVARAFLEAGNAAYAASSFGKAREAEKIYALDVDEERRREAFLEFALNGALTNKVMTEYARDLSERHGDEKAYAYFFDLCVRRTLGGTPPHAQMVQQLRKLARAAKLKAPDEDQRFLLEIWEAPSLSKAAHKFWTTYRKAFVKLAGERADIRGRLLNTFPSPSGEQAGFKADWITFLQEASALDALTAEAGAAPAEAQPEGGPTVWFAKLLHHSMDDRYYWRTSSAPDAMFDLLRTLKDRFIADGVPVKFDSGDGYYSRIDVDLIDLALELNVPVAPLAEGNSFDLGIWAEPDDESTERPRDLRFVAEDGRFDEALDMGVGAVFGQATFQKAAQGCVGLESARRTWLERRTKNMADAALPALIERMHELQNNTSARTFAEFPEAFEAILALSPAAALQRTLNIGVVNELTWPTFEKAFAELDGPNGVNVSGGVPFAVLRNARKVIVVSGDERLLEHDLNLPKDREPREVYYSNGQVLVAYYDAGWNLTGYWSGKPKHTFSLSYPSTSTIAAVLDNGNTTIGDRELVPGDETPSVDAAKVYSDGEHFWKNRGYYNSYDVVEFDPKNGKEGRKSLPAFFEEWAETGKELDLWSCYLYRTPKPTSLLGAKDGLYGWRVRHESETSNYEYQAIDGRHTTVSTDGLVSLPGSDEPRLLSENLNTLRSPDGKIASDNAYGGGAFASLNIHALHAATYRDEKGSIAMRSITEAGATTLLLAAILDSLDVDMHAVGTEQKFLSTLIERLENSQLEGDVKTLKAEASAFVSWLRKDGDRPKAAFDGSVESDKRGRVWAMLPTILPDVTDSFLAQTVWSVFERAAHHIKNFAQSMAEADPEFVTIMDPDLMVSDEAVGRALGNMVGYSRHYYGQNGESPLDAPMRVISKFLLEGVLEGQLHRMSSSLQDYLGRIGIPAFFSVARGTTSEQRDVLHKFLKLWHETGWDQLRENLRVSTVVFADKGLKEIGLASDSGTFLLNHNGNRFWGINLNSWNETRFIVVEFAPEGSFKGLPHTTIEQDRVVDPNAWGSPEQVEAFLAAAEAHDGVLPWDPDAIAELSRLTGLTTAEASLVWVGMPNLTTWEKNFLDKELRTEMGLKVAEADAARQTLRNLPTDQVEDFYAHAIPPTPVELFTADGTARFAENWNARMGQRVALPEDLLVDVEKSLSLGFNARRLLVGILTDDAPEFTNDATVRFEKDEYYNEGISVVFDGPKASDDEDAVYFSGEALGAALTGITYLNATLPVGDPVRAELPAFYRRVAERLINPDLMFYLSSHYLYDAPEGQKDLLLDSIGGKRHKIHGEEYVDNGFLVGIPARWAVQIFYRPAQRIAGKSDPVYTRESQGSGSSYATAPFLELFLSQELKRIIERIESTPIETGQFEVNPLHSVPELVLDVGKKHDISENAAVLYLQTLALHNPTTKFVRQWNGWTAGKYKKAAEELVARELLLEAKRSRAARKHFLPGGWEALKKPNLPIETWKLPLYGADEHGSAALGQLLALKPVHELFEEAWNRIESGDLPGF